jgi:Tfp pilus assembly protein PilZ
VAEVAIAVSVQAEPRFRKRVPCRLRWEGRSFSGLVLNLSRGGLFVQTSAAARPGDHVELNLSELSRPADALTGEVVWRRAASHELRSVAQSGMGLRLHRAPEAYYELLSQLAPNEPFPSRQADVRPDAERTGTPSRRFVVRIKRDGGPRTKTLSVEAPSEEDARSRTLASAGEGWSILDLRSED